MASVLQRTHAKPGPAKPVDLPSWVDPAQLRAVRIWAGWDKLAACAGTSTSIWFSAVSAANVDFLRKHYCDGCPVRVVCLADAITSERIVADVAGVRAGLSPTERRWVHQLLGHQLDGQWWSLQAVVTGVGDVA